MPSQLILLELNEINFDHVRAYCAKGKLPALAKLLLDHPLIETRSEAAYEQLEPWIQWVTAHTGLVLREHGIFRLGDFGRSEAEQIWEYLERNGRSVGAISPMNAVDRCTRPAFFMPDPWTNGRVSGSLLLRRLYRSIAQAVNDNAEARLSPGSMVWLLAGLLRYARPASYASYLGYLRGLTNTRPWLKALFLDRLLADLFLGLVRRHRPDFASLFLNAGAHVQHHYMFSASVYGGPRRNPDWYVAAGQDPVLDVYRLYDHIIAEVARTFPAARLMLATGLHQDPHAEETFYWRLKDHASFLLRIGVPFRSVEPRMSRDFLIRCTDAAEAGEAERIILSAVSAENMPLFEVDNRGDDLFVMLTWRADISSDFVFKVGNRSFEGLRDDVAFVAIKNGEHNGVGYFLDSGITTSAEPHIPLASLPARICAALGLEWAPRLRASPIADPL